MKIKHIILLLSIGISHLCFAPVAPMPKMGTPEFDTMIMEQMQALEKELASKSPEEQEEFIKMLAQVGEEITKEAQSKGYENPFDYIEKELASALEDQETQEEQESQPEVAAAPAPVVDKKAERSLAELLKVLADHIASLRDKTVSTPYAPKVELIKYRLDDLVYYLEIFQNANLLEHSALPEHKQFVEKLQNLEIKIAPLSADLTIIPFNLEGENHYAVLDIGALSSPEEITEAYHQAMAINNPERIRASMAKEGASVEDIKKATLSAQQKADQLQKSYRAIVQNLKAENILDALVEAFIEATNPNGILDGFKSLLEKYEPTLAQQRAAVQQAQDAARKAQEKAIAERPVFRVLNPTAFDNAAWRPSYSFDAPNNYNRVASPSSTSASTPQTTPSSSKEDKAPLKSSGFNNKKDAKKEDAKDDKKDKKDKTDKDLKEEKKKSNDVQRRVGATESVLSALKTTLKTNAQDIKDFSAYLSSTADDAAKNKRYEKLFKTIAEQLSMVPVGFKRALSEFKSNPVKLNEYTQGMSTEWRAFLAAQEYKDFAALTEAYQKMVGDPAKPLDTISANKKKVVAALQEALKAFEVVQALVKEHAPGEPDKKENKDIQSVNAQQPSKNNEEQKEQAKPNDQDDDNQPIEFKEESGPEDQGIEKKPLIFKQKLDDEPQERWLNKKSSLDLAKDVVKDAEARSKNNKVKWNTAINISDDEMPNEHIIKKHKLNPNDPNFKQQLEQKKIEELNELNQQMKDDAVWQKDQNK